MKEVSKYHSYFLKRSTKYLMTKDAPTDLKVTIGSKV